MRIVERVLKGDFNCQKTCEIKDSMLRCKLCMAKVIYKQKDKIVYIILNRPQVLNAIGVEMWSKLDESLERFRDDLEARVAIITGAGDRSFCVGQDVKEMAQGESGIEKMQFSPSMLPSLDPERGMTVWKPIIAAINGYCLGAGFFIALSCDIRIATDNATFAASKVSLGLMPDMGITQWLPHVISLSAALELILSGRTITAQEAFHFGFVNKIVTQQDLLPTAEALAHQICDNGPLAVSLAKKAVYQGLGIPLPDGLDLEKQFYQLASQSEDAKEGLRAFTEKRKPDYKGK